MLIDLKLGRKGVREFEGEGRVLEDWEQGRKGVRGLDWDQDGNGVSHFVAVLAKEEALLVLEELKALLITHAEINLEVLVECKLEAPGSW